jgi:hypothetical protein
MRLAPAAAVLMCAFQAAHADEIRIGPGGVRIPVTTEFYQDQHHRRHVFQVPGDWRDYHHPLGWYRVHPQWWRGRDWYRRAGNGVDARAAQSESHG